MHMTRPGITGETPGLAIHHLAELDECMLDHIGSSMTERREGEHFDMSPRITTEPLRDVGTYVYADGILLGYYWPPASATTQHRPVVAEVAPDCPVAHAEGRIFHIAPLLSAGVHHEHYGAPEAAVDALLLALRRPSRELVESHDSIRDPGRGVREAVHHARTVLEEQGDQRRTG